jgi:hypothetical protein
MEKDSAKQIFMMQININVLVLMDILENIVHGVKESYRY